MIPTKSGREVPSSIVDVIILSTEFRQGIQDLLDEIEVREYHNDAKDMVYIWGRHYASEYGTLVTPTLVIEAIKEEIILV